jgi:Holliday junction resolvasome RuvABC endonuclease subunit
MGFGGQKGSPGRVFHLGELGGVLKTMLWERGIDVLIVPNTVLKKVIIGKAGGNVKKAVTKEDMVSALAGYGYRVAQFDEADATGLMLCGEWKTDATQIPKNARQSNRFGSLSQCETVRGKLQSIAKS